ncbi:MAG: hypothetical protein WBA43_17710 [Elainellaceae cyanobacterium]
MTRSPMTGSAEAIAQQKAQKLLKLYSSGRKTFSMAKLVKGHLHLRSPNLEADIPQVDDYFFLCTA